MDALLGLLVTIGPVLVLAVSIFFWRRRRVEVISSFQAGLLYRDGVFQRELPPGVHVFYAPANRVAVVRLTAVEQGGTGATVDVASRDGFAFRLRLGYRYLIADRRGYHEASAGRAQGSAGIALPGFDDALAAAAMAAVAARTLAEAQADPAAIGVELLAALAPAYPTVTLTAMTVAGLLLPPETRKLLSEVEASRLRGLAALERARGEQAALRALANAARLMRDQPELGQLRLLQAIETARKAPTLVIGQPAAAGLGAARRDED